MKKNIAIVITRLDLGGAQQVALYLAEHLDRRKFNVHLIAGQGGYLDSGLRTPGSGLTINLWPELVHPIDPLADVMSLFKLISYFEKNKIDIVHTHSSKAGILGRMAAAMSGVKRIIHTVHGFPFHEFQNPLAHYFYLLVEKAFAPFTTKLIAVGRDVMEYGLKKGVGTADKYVIIRPGVDLGKFKARGTGPGVKSFLKKHGLKPDAFTVGMIGNCKKQKNPAAFAQIASLVIGEKPGTQFIFAGEGPLRAGAEAFIKAKKISDRVKFIGWTDEPEVMMQSLDVFLLTSLWEGIPCTLAQAAAAGKPIVATDIGGNREFMEAISASKHLYDPKDCSAAAADIISMMKGPARKIPHAKILKEFDLKYTLKKHENLYLADSQKL